MGNRFSGVIVTAAIAIAVAGGTTLSVSVTRTFAQTPASSGAALKTAWGEPDLQGIWTDEFDTPLQRPAKYANQEFFTEGQRAELDQARSGNRSTQWAASYSNPGGSEDSGGGSGISPRLGAVDRYV
jgi:hypothetical protein